MLMRILGVLAFYIALNFALGQQCSGAECDAHKQTKQTSGSVLIQTKHKIGLEPIEENHAATNGTGMLELHVDQNPTCNAPVVDGARTPSCRQGAVRQENQVCNAHCQNGYAASVNQIRCTASGWSGTFTCDRIPDHPSIVAGCGAQWCVEADKTAQCRWVPACQTCSWCADVRQETTNCKSSCWPGFEIDTLDLEVCSWDSCLGCEECTSPCDTLCTEEKLRVDSWKSCTNNLNGGLCKNCPACLAAPTEARLDIFCPLTSANMMDNAAPADGILHGSTHWWPNPGQPRPYDSPLWEPLTYKDEFGINLQLYRKFANGVYAFTEGEKMFIQKGGVIWLTWQVFDWITTVQGAMDEELLQLAELVKSVYPAKVIASPGFEPDHYVCPGSNCRGTASDYSDAFDYAADFFQGRGVTNVLWAVDYSHESAFTITRKDTPEGDQLLLDLLPKRAAISWVFWNMFMAADRENMNEYRSPWPSDGIPWWCGKLTELSEYNQHLKTAKFGVGAWGGGGMMTKLASNGGETVPMPEEAYQDYILDAKTTLKAIDDTESCPQFKAIVHFNSLDGIISTSDFFADDIIANHDYANGNAETVFDKNEAMYPTFQKYLVSWPFAKNDQLVSNVRSQCRPYEEVPEPTQITDSPTPVPPPSPAPTWTNNAFWGSPILDTRCHANEQAGSGWGDLGYEISKVECMNRCAANGECKFVTYKALEGGNQQCTSFKSCNTRTYLAGHETYEKNPLGPTPEPTPEPTLEPTPEPPTPAPTWANNVVWGSPLLEMRCHGSELAGNGFGDLGTYISKTECLNRCAAREACKFVAYKTVPGGNQQCTSFTSCNTRTPMANHETYEKNPEGPTPQPTPEPTLEPTAQPPTSEPTWANNVVWGSPIFETRCNGNELAGNIFGDLGTFISIVECLNRCAAMEACKFVSYKAIQGGNQQCTSFKSCNDPTAMAGHETYEKNPVGPTSQPTPEPTAAPTVEPTWTNNVAWGSPILQTRCHNNELAGSGFGDLGEYISKVECLNRCAANEACKFVTYKTIGNQQCTSFKSCNDHTAQANHESYEKIVWGSPILETRCHFNERAGSGWGDLGIFVSKDECLNRCAAEDACKFVSYKSIEGGNQQCTSFTSCNTRTATTGHETYEKNPGGPTPEPTHEPTIEPTAEPTPEPTRAPTPEPPTPAPTWTNNFAWGPPIFETRCHTNELAGNGFGDLGRFISAAECLNRCAANEACKFVTYKAVEGGNQQCTSFKSCNTRTPLAGHETYEKIPGWPTPEPTIEPTAEPTAEPTLEPTRAPTPVPPTPAPTWTNNVVWGPPILETRCHTNELAGDGFGDLGMFISAAECLNRCAANEACKFVTYKAVEGGNQQCTSFKSCNTRTPMAGHETYEKIPGWPTPQPTPEPTLEPTAQPPTSEPTWVNNVVWSSPLPQKRCHVSGRVGSTWGDLGSYISKEECLNRCAAMEECKFVTYKTIGNKQCTSFRSCDTQTNLNNHEIYEKGEESTWSWLFR